MTDKQFELKKEQLREEMKSHGYGWVDGKYIRPPKEYEMREEELYCINMINSILAYRCFGFTAEQVMQSEEKSHYNYLENYVKKLGRDKVVSLIQGQIDSIDKINSCVFTDGEGCTYNSITWKN